MLREIRNKIRNPRGVPFVSTPFSLQKNNMELRKELKQTKQILDNAEGYAGLTLNTNKETLLRDNMKNFIRIRVKEDVKIESVVKLGKKGFKWAKKKGLIERAQNRKQKRKVTRGRIRDEKGRRTAAVKHA